VIGSQRGNKRKGQ